MNDLHAEFGDKGLVIVGVTDEGSKLIEKYIPEFSVDYPMVQATGRSDWGVSAFPTYFFIGPDGEVISQSKPSKAQVEEALRDVVLMPELPDSRTFTKVGKALEKKQYGKALEEIKEQLQDDGIEPAEREVLVKVESVLQQLWQSTSDKIDAATNGPDYYKTVQWLERVEDRWKGSELEDRAEATIEKLEDDDAINDEIKAGKTLEALNAKYRDDVGGSKSKRKRASAAYEAFIRKYGKSFYAEAAREMIRRLAKD